MDKQQPATIATPDLETEAILRAAGLPVVATRDAEYILVPSVSGAAIAPHQARQGTTVIALGAAPASLAETAAFGQAVEQAGGRFVFLPAIAASAPARAMRELITTEAAGDLQALQAECFDDQRDPWCMVETGVAFLTSMTGSPAMSVTAQMHGGVIAASIRFPGLQAQLLAGRGRPAMHAAAIGMNGRISWDGQSVTLQTADAHRQSSTADIDDAIAAVVQAVFNGHAGLGLHVVATVEAIRTAVATNGPGNPAAESWKAAGISVHPTAVIDEGASIGSGSRIWHFSHILPGVHIGKSVNIGQNVVIGPDVTVGDRCRIQNNVSLYKGVMLETGVFCGPSCVFTNVNNPRAEIERKTEFLPTLVRQGASIGANATIVCGHTLGRYCFIAAGAVVTTDVPDFALMAGVPARRIGWMSHAGGRLGPDLVCPIERRQYRLNNTGMLEEYTP